MTTQETKTKQQDGDEDAWVLEELDKTCVPATPPTSPDGTETQVVTTTSNSENNKMTSVKTPVGVSEPPKEQLKDEKKDEKAGVKPEEKQKQKTYEYDVTTNVMTFRLGTEQQNDCCIVTFVALVFGLLIVSIGSSYVRRLHRIIDENEISETETHVVDSSITFWTPHDQRGMGSTDQFLCVDGYFDDKHVAQCPEHHYVWALHRTGSKSSFPNVYLSDPITNLDRIQCCGLIGPLAVDNDKLQKSVIPVRFDAATSWIHCPHNQIIMAFDTEPIRFHKPKTKLDSLFLYCRPSPFANTTKTHNVIIDISQTFDNYGWATCPENYLMTGIQRNVKDPFCSGLYCMERIECIGLLGHEEEVIQGKIFENATTPQDVWKIVQDHLEPKQLELVVKFMIGCGLLVTIATGLFTLFCMIIAAAPQPPLRALPKQLIAYEKAEKKAEGQPVNQPAVPKKEDSKENKIDQQEEAKRQVKRKHYYYNRRKNQAKRQYNAV
jgi:hypothetical protein